MKLSLLWFLSIFSAQILVESIFIANGKVTFLAHIWNGNSTFFLLFINATIVKAQNMPLRTAAIPHPATPSLRSGGLLSTQWDQDYPYNQLCPRDPLNGNSYSYAGCPAVAMAQIVNYLRTTLDTRFSDNDGYFHLFRNPDSLMYTTLIANLQAGNPAHLAPVSDVLYVKNLPCEQVNYSIFNVLGQEILTGPTSGTISVADLENGLYFLHIKSKDYQKTAKFVVR